MVKRGQKWSHGFWHQLEEGADEGGVLEGGKAVKKKAVKKKQLRQEVKQEVK